MAHLGGELGEAAHELDDVADGLVELHRHL